MPTRIDRQRRPVAQRPTVLRTVYLTPTGDAQLRRDAFEQHRPKADLLLEYLRRGMALTAEGPGSTGTDHVLPGTTERG